jgi:hypothetical protein
MARIWTRLNVRELDECKTGYSQHGNRKVTKVESLHSIASVIKDFQFFVCEKWQLASDRQGSGNTANIGSTTYIEDILKGNGVFAMIGEDWFDEYWMNYGLSTMKKDGKTVPIRRIEDFIDFNGGDKKLIPMATKKKADESSHSSNKKPRN